MPDYARAHAAVEAYLREFKAADGLDLALGLADGIAGLAGGGEIASGVISALSLVKSLSDADLKVTPNIHFVENGHERPSPMTFEYMRNRSIKNVGAVAVSIGGAAASGYTGGVNTLGMAKDVNAAGSTGAHLYKLSALLNNPQWAKSKTVHDWIALTITMKKHKLGSRAISAAGNASVFVAIPATLGNAFLKLHIKKSYGAIVGKTAQEIHWRAFQEQGMDRVRGSGTGRGAVGPATAIVHELFERRGVTRILGRHKADEIIAEPAGWHAISDKLNLM